MTSFRPSVIFGRGDSLFNRFARLLRMAPGVFPLTCPNSLFQPGYVGDVVAALVRALDDRGSWDRHYNLCGPQVYTLRELVLYTARLMERRVWVLGLGDLSSRIQARILERLPGRPFSYDNYLSLQVDSVCDGNDLARLGVQASVLEAVVPLYLGSASQRRY